MADPDFRTKSREQCRCGDCDFIRRELIPEMVHDRRFCESGSREFVEFDSVDIEHLDGIRDYTTRLYRVTARVKFSGETCSFPLVIKLPKADAESPPSGPFQNEEMFYSKMTLEYGTDGIPKCYLSDLGRYGRPVIVLEDLSARGYAHVKDKLDEDHLKLCVKALAAFHGRGLRLKARKFPIFREFYAKLSVPDSLYSDQQMLDASVHLSFASLESNLVEKIKGKLHVMESLSTEINDVSIVCHGHFTRDNVLFKHENGKPSDVKMIDWETMRYCSPAIDFALILFTNIPDESELPKVEAFCRNILRFYLDTVKGEYPEVERELLERDIIAKLLLGYISLCDDDPIRITYQELGMMLHVLDGLGSLD
ncbi:uncharacterized protein LOC115237426 [Formica exsecta]|uniref:uncharacterized protein LOC115237426 n=1 Tax=Formica exsecta TaxID=72781 RepID=UPI001141AFE9|nr:uncharacterized protein LOC115237426 [Formica exsecta]XP_029666307.1 uncharacterized protein LOC115237426 [Formica exsecta]XP_029666308.1 uncharacterized protein LOC115237426 [Formica exsecta]XP_029666309.1 uncharacterized protein LOC115237426 [Formica exsecta]XP_029666310.1 uncharacterized protein LOC115237426 [Formica exsecta]